MYILFQVRIENLPGGFGSLTKTLHPKVRMAETFGSLLSHEKTGAALAFAFVGERLCKMLDVRTASAQNCTGSPLLISIQRAELTTDWIAHSATPLCSGFLAVGHVWAIPLLTHHLAVSLLTNSLPPSEWMAFTVLTPQTLLILVMVSNSVWEIVFLVLWKPIK